MTSLPIEEAFPTGTGNETLVLMVCAGFLWAGRYAGATTGTPVQVVVTTARSVTAKPRALHWGRTPIALHPRALKRACRWLSRQGITVREQLS